MIFQTAFSKIKYCIGLVTADLFLLYKNEFILVTLISTKVIAPGYS